MLNPDSDKYIWNLIGGLKSHIPSQELQRKETLEVMNVFKGETSAVREDLLGKIMLIVRNIKIGLKIKKNKRNIKIGN